MTLLAESWNVQALPKERIVLETDQRLVVRISAPADEITLNGTLVFFWAAGTVSCTG